MYIYEVNLSESVPQPCSNLFRTKISYFWGKYILWESSWCNSRLSVFPESAVKHMVSVMPHTVVAAKLSTFNE